MPAPPSAVVPGGVVASPTVDPVMVLEVGSVEAAVLSEKLALIAVPVGMHVPDRSEVPNGEMVGDDALEGGDEDDSPDIPIALLASMAALVVKLVIPVAGHIVIVPRDGPGIGPRFPRLS